LHETRRLAEFVADTSYADLPPQVVDAIKIDILDDLAAGFAGARTPWAEMVADLTRDTAAGPCSLFARSWTTSPSYAALTNGVMIGGFECDHPYSPGSCHPSAAVFPAVLAIGERERLDGRSFIAAVALGYEALCRIGAAATRAVEDERGFHGPGTNAAFGGAAGAGKALGLSADRLVNALGIAGSHGGGLLEFFRDGSMTKRLHIGRGAQMGLESALLAARGFTGPATVLEGDRGFLRVYSPSPRPELLCEALGERYLLLDMGLKAYPCHISFHAVVDAVQRFRASQQYEPQQIERVRIEAAGRMLEERHRNPRPTTLLGAQYSLPWSAALALCRDVSDPTSWSEGDLADPEISRLAELMELRETGARFGSAGGPVAEITVVVAGKTLAFAAADWKGAPTDPYTYGDMAGKFARYAAPYVSPSRIDEIVNRVARLENETDAAMLAEAIRSDEGPFA